MLSNDFLKSGEQFDRAIEQATREDTLKAVEEFYLNLGNHPECNDCISHGDRIDCPRGAITGDCPAWQAEKKRLLKVATE